jgi:hypothetical protein
MYILQYIHQTYNFNTPSARPEFRTDARPDSGFPHTPTLASRATGRTKIHQISRLTVAIVTGTSPAIRNGAAASRRIPITGGDKT